MRQFPPAGAVFDIGGGNGFVAKAIEDAGFEVALVEPGPTGARNALRRGLHSVVCATLEDAAFVPGSMPAVGLFDVVEHMRDDRDFLERVRAQLAPNGRLYLTVPAYQAFWSQEDVDAGHYRRYSRTSLSNLLLASGFAIDFLSGFFRFLLPAILAVRVVPHRLGLAKSPAPEEAARHMAKQHIPQTGWTRELLRRFEQGELAAIRAQTPLPYGASWLLVARNAQSR